MNERDEPMKGLAEWLPQAARLRSLLPPGYNPNWPAEVEASRQRSAVGAEPVASSEFIAQFGDGRPLRYSLDDYWRAPGDGPLHFTWTDKPHRLIYDLVAAVKYYAAPPSERPAAPAQAGVTDEQFRGYAKLGAGGYFVFHTDKPDAAELIISLADDESCRTLKVGDDTPPIGTVQPEQMAVRIEFTCVEALDVLENQLRQLRAEHFGETPSDGVTDEQGCEMHGLAHPCEDCAAELPLLAALSKPGCERLREFYEVGPVQRAAVESFADALGVKPSVITEAMVEAGARVMCGPDAMTPDNMRWGRECARRVLEAALGVAVAAKTSDGTSNGDTK